MRYASICSGVGSDHLAFSELGWECAFFSEIEKFPIQVLNYHWPNIPVEGDFTKIKGDDYEAVELVIGGTPCQSFSVSGKRGGMDDPRGSLAIEHVRLASRLGARWIVWENVPGVFSSKSGEDFGSFIHELRECGYGFAYRVLNSQYFGVPQRRRRVFLVGYIGDWRPAAAVLFESESLQGNTEKGSSQRKENPKCREVGTRERSGERCIAVKGYTPAVNYKTHATLSTKDGHHRNLVVVPFAQNSRDELRIFGDGTKVGAITSTRGVKQQTYITFHPTQDPICTHDMSHCIDRNGVGLATEDVVRKLTPEECERLQGMPTGHTRIPWNGKPKEECPISHRYKAIGNAFTVNVVRWIGKRIDTVHKMLKGD